MEGPYVQLLAIQCYALPRDYAQAPHCYVTHSHSSPLLLRLQPLISKHVIIIISDQKITPTRKGK